MLKLGIKKYKKLFYISQIILEAFHKHNCDNDDNDERYMIMNVRICEIRERNS